MLLESLKNPVDGRLLLNIGIQKTDWHSTEPTSLLAQRVFDLWSWLLFSQYTSSRLGEQTSSVLKQSTAGADTALQITNSAQPVPGVAAVLAPEGATGSLLWCQQEASAQKSATSQPKGLFKWKCRMPGESSLLRSVLNSVMTATSNSKWHPSCVSLLWSNQIARITQNTVKCCQKIVRVHAHVCSEITRAVFIPQPCCEFESTLVERTKGKTSRTHFVKRELRRKAVHWKELQMNADVRASSAWFLRDTCNIFCLLNTVRSPLLKDWTLLNLDCAQSNDFWSQDRELG